MRITSKGQVTIPIDGYTLLTRDASCYRTYFPRLPVIAPATA